MGFEKKTKTKTPKKRIFDEDGSGDVDYKEIAVGIEFLAEGDTEEKLARIFFRFVSFAGFEKKNWAGFFDICDEDNNGAISEKEFYNVLKLNIIHDKDKALLWQTVKQIFASVRKTSAGELSRFGVFYGMRKRELKLAQEGIECSYKVKCTDKRNY